MADIRRRYRCGYDVTMISHCQLLLQSSSSITGVPLRKSKFHWSRFRASNSRSIVIATSRAALSSLQAARDRRSSWKRHLLAAAATTGGGRFNITGFNLRYKPSLKTQHQTYQLCDLLFSETALSRIFVCEWSFERVLSQKNTYCDNSIVFIQQ